MNKIQQLSPGVIQKLRSGIAFMNVAHCVEELVLNSIDAGASCIAVNVNLPVYQVQVIDNGNGIEIEEMKIIGTRYATSKCHKLEDLQSLKSGGFRGEALSSLKEVSSVLMIESRPSSSTETYCKIFTQGKALDPKRSINSRPSKGTSVTVYDFMYNLPVRRKSISDALDIEECRKILQSIALMHPNVSFTLKNEATGEMSLQLKKCSSLYHCFTQIFGGSRAWNLKNIDYLKSDYSVSGCISIDCHVSKDLQFLYVNKRQVLRTKIHKLINSILNKVLSSRQKSNVQVSTSNVMPDTSSPAKNQSYCIFALNISCPYDKYDIIFEPRKTMIEFSDWDSVLKVVEGALTEFLKSQNLTLSAEETDVDVINNELIQGAGTSNFNAQDCRQGLFSHVVCRLFEPVDSSKNSPTERQLEASSALSNGPISYTLKEQLASNLNDEHSNLALLKNQEPSSAEPGPSSKNNLICVSLMDNYQSNNKIDPSVKSKEVELDIPRRTVFASQNPVMLRIPVKSSLADLQSKCSSANLRKLKDKIQQFARKEKTLLVTNKPDKRCEPNIRFNDALNSSSKSLSLENSPVLSFNAGKYEVKLKEFRNPNLTDKSSQCPSVSHCQKSAKDLSNNVSNLQERLVARTTSDKSLQCPSVSVIKPAKVVSRFQFGEDSTILNLKCLKQSKRFKKKASPGDFIAVPQNILNNVDGDIEFPVVKKLKSSHCISIDDSPVSPNQSIGNEDMEFDTSDVSEIRVSTKKCMNNFHAYDSPDILELFHGSPPVAHISERLKETSTFSRVNLSCLQTFVQSKNAKNIAQDLTELKDADCSKEIELFCIDDDGVDNDANNRHELSSSQTFSPFKIPTEILDCVKEIEKEVCDIVKRNRNLHSDGGDVVEHMQLDVSTSDKNISSDNSSVNSLFLVSPMLDNDDSTDVDNTVKNYLSNLQTTNSCLRDNDVVERNQIESFRFGVSQEEVAESLNINEKLNHQQSRNNLLELDVVGFKQTGDVNFESYPFTECLPSFSEKILLDSDKKLQKNQDSEKKSNCLSQELFEDLTHEISGTVEVFPQQHLDDPCKLNSNDISHPSSSKNKSDENGASNNGLKNEDPISLNQWELQSEPKTKRKIYVDTVTGNSTYLAPKLSEKHTNQDVCLNNGVSKKSHFFLSHDFSPFVTKTQTPKDNSKINKPALVNDLRNFIENHDKQEKYVKWRSSQDDSKCDDNDIENMLSAWDNPMFEVPYEETSINSNKISQNVCQMYSFLNSYKFSKNSLDSIQVIGQVDCKFIACILTDFNEDSKGNKLLALFDQHAVHERIRLEEITEDLYKDDGNGLKSVKTVAIDPPLEISLSDEEVRLLSTYREKLHKIGIYIKIDSNAKMYSVYSVPACLVHKETAELRRSLPDSISILQNSTSEWLSSLVKTRSIPQVLPKTLLSVLNYQACRGAVKFGDPLTLEQCSDLLKALSGCKLPFQCAHGRPSIAPLLDLKKIEALYKKRPAPQLKALNSQFQQ